MQFLSRFFEFHKFNTNFKIEFIAGLSTFMMMAYVLLVQPGAIVGFGNDFLIDDSGTKITKEAIMITCALCTGLVTLIMAIYTNLPFALSTGMGFNFMFGIMLQNNEMSYASIMTIIFITGAVLALFSIFGLRELIVKILPRNLKIAIAAAIGFFIAYIGFKTTGIGVFENGSISMGDVSNPQVMLAIFGLAIMCFLTAHNIKGAMFYGIIIVSVLGIPFGITKVPNSFFSLPNFSDLANITFKFDFTDVLTLKGFILIFIVIVGEFFNTLGTLLGVASKANMLDKDGNLENIQKPFLVDSIGTMLGALFGNTVVTTYVESAAGVEAGGRTGFSTTIVAILFLLMIFISPLVLMIPAAATGPALIFVGFLMIKEFQQIDLSDFSEAIGPLVMVIFTIFTASIAGGISAGILAFIFTKLALGKFKDVHIVLYFMAIPLIAFFVFE